MFEYSQLPKSLQQAVEKQLVYCISHFGSSVYTENPNDIDLLVVTNFGKFYDFRKLIDPSEFVKFDISLIKLEECQSSNPSAFRYGSCGAYLVNAFVEGRLLYGSQTPFGDWEFPNELLRRTIYDRLNDYMHAVRKALFSPSGIDSEIYRRWRKFKRSSLFLIDPDEKKFPDVMYIPEQELLEWALILNVVIPDSDDVLENYERLWDIVLRRTELNSIYKAF